MGGGPDHLSHPVPLCQQLASDLRGNNRTPDDSADSLAQQRVLRDSEVPGVQVAVQGCEGCSQQNQRVQQATELRVPTLPGNGAFERRPHKVAVAEPVQQETVLLPEHLDEQNQPFKEAAKGAYNEHPAQLPEPAGSPLAKETGGDDVLHLVFVLQHLLQHQLRPYVPARPPVPAGGVFGLR